jgi:predicted transcriptional regulator
MQATPELITALRRKRGELNISNTELARQTGVSVWTIRYLLNKQRDQIRPSTAAKLNAWLYTKI